MTQIELTELIRQRAEKSNLYKRLDQDRRVLFERVVETYSRQVLNGASTRDIKHEWNTAVEKSGADTLLESMKSELAASFGVNGGAFNSAIRNAARDVLHVFANPKVHSSIKGLLTIRQRSQHMDPNEIVPGRKLSTTETQPPNTGPRTLRRRK